jgi:hypothetical protein
MTGTTLRPIPDVITKQHARNKRVKLQEFIYKFEIGEEFSSSQAAVAANLSGPNCARGLLRQWEEVISVGKGIWRRVK